jgi:hypothetical protein
MSDFKIYKASELNNTQYHSEKSHWSSSNLKSLLKNTQLAYNEKVLGDTKEVSKSSQANFDDGNLAHTLILEPELFNVEFAIFEGFRKSGKEFEIFKSIEMESANRTIISRGQYNKVEGWVKAFFRNGTANMLLDGCNSEMSVFGELNGMPLKARADAINIEKGYIIDLKTSGYETDLDNFKFTLESMEYDLSASLYCQMFERAFNKPFTFYWIVLGKKSKTCDIYKMSEDTRNKGTYKVRKAINLWKKCTTSGVWKDNNTLELNLNQHSDYEILEI